MNPLPAPSLAGRSRVVLGTACALVLAIFWGSAHPGLLERLGGSPAQSYYNLLVQGFQDGRLSVKKAVPPGLAQLPDPYDPAANHPYRYAPYLVHDLSYYQGRLYLYFGVTPALLLFWPWAALTGHYVAHGAAVAVFCSAGFLAGALLLREIWRRYFPDVPAWIAGALCLALGLATSAPILLQGAEVYQVAISCAYALEMLALGAVWLSLHRPAERGRWIFAAGLALGLAIGARPPVLLCAAILAVPLHAAWRAGGKREAGRLAAAAALPLLLCGLGLLIYNFQRFGDWAEFGQRYQLASNRQDLGGHFSARYLWFNFRLYFLEPAPWSGGFPWVRRILPPAAPAGHGPVEDPFGILTSLPFCWLALAAPLAWRRSASANEGRLRSFLLAVAVLFVLSAGPLLLFYWNCSRYEMEFLPPLVLLGVAGVFGLERSLAARPAWRRGVRAAWGLLLAYSIAFSLLAGLERRAEARREYGTALYDLGRLPEAMAEFRAALAIRPGYADAHDALGVALALSGLMPEAIAEFQAALRGDPRLPDAHANLGNALLQTGRPAAAVAEYAEACRLQPASAKFHYNLAYGLAQAGRGAEAVGQYEEAVRLQPDSAVMHFSLALALRQAGRTGEADAQRAEALRLDPSLARRAP